MASRHRQFRSRRILMVLFLSSLSVCLWLNHVPFTTMQARWEAVATAQSPNASQLTQQGIQHYQAGDVQGAITTWQTALTAYQRNNNLANQALVREKLAIAYQQVGQFGAALDHWKAVIAHHRSSGDFVKVGRLLTEQAQTYSRLGQTRDAIVLLCGASETDDCLGSEGSALQIAQKLNDDQGEVAALGSIGEAYRLKGKYDKAIETLESSLTIVQENNLPAYRSSVLNSLGNAYFSKAQLNQQRANSAQLRGAETKGNEFIQKAKAESAKALDYFNNGLELTRTQNDSSGHMQGLLNLLQLYSRTNESKLLHSANQVQVRQEALTLLERLPNSSTKVYAAINLAELGQPTSATTCTSVQAQSSPRQLNNSQAEALLNQAVSLAQGIKDSRAESFALGKLGHLYECRKDYGNALEFTNQARLAADQNLRAKDSLYLWEWQAGRIFKAQAKVAKASDAYERAIATLEGEGGIRDNLLVAERDLQFNFRDTISPLYREYARLKLEQAESLRQYPDSCTPR